MTLDDFPGIIGGQKTYGITFDLDIHVLEDEMGVSRQDARSSIEKSLQGLGYKHVQYSVYVCPNPLHSEIQVVAETVDVLRGLPWFSQAVRQAVAFDLASWGGTTNMFKPHA